MKKLVLLSRMDGGGYFDDDVWRIVQVCLSAGYKIDPQTAFIAWERYSDSIAAGWMTLPENDEVVLRTVLNYTSIEEMRDGRSGK